MNCTTEGSYREDHVCGFYQELVPFKTAQQKCEDVGMKICDRTENGEGPTLIFVTGWGVASER